jgi:CIC family chloride channel protein
MFAEGIAFIALRHRSLYHAQVGTKRDSPAHRDDLIFDVLKSFRVGDVVVKNRPYVTFTRKTPAAEVIQRVADSAWQDAFPVLETDGKLAGVISSDILRTMASDPEVSALALADDMMAAPLSVRENEDLHVALDLMLKSSVRELLVVDESGTIVGFLDEADVTRVYHSATSKP